MAGTLANPTVLAAADTSCAVVLWNVVTAQALHTFRLDGQHLTPSAPGAAHAATASSARNVLSGLTSASTSSKLRLGGASAASSGDDYTGNGLDTIRALHWSADGCFLVAIVRERQVVVLDVRRRTTLWQRTFDEPLLAFRWDPFDSSRSCLATTAGYDAATAMPTLCGVC